MTPPNQPPTTIGEMMAHIHYIRERVDETHSDVRMVRDATVTHRAEIDAVKLRVEDLEDHNDRRVEPPPQTTYTGGTVGGVLGGLVSGFLSGWLGK